jgi:hypothetical protein
MKRSTKGIVLSALVLGVSANTLIAQPYAFDENGNGQQYIALQPHPLPFEVAPDPSGGITSSPVLIYLLGASVISGDVAIMRPDGVTTAGLLRFFTPVGTNTSDVIFYSRTAGTLAGVGIPQSTNPVQIDATNPQTTVWFPGSGQPGASTLVALPTFEFFRYTISIEVPEPALPAQLLAAGGVWLVVRHTRRLAARKGSDAGQVVLE